MIFISALWAMDWDGSGRVGRQVICFTFGTAHPELLTGFSFTSLPTAHDPEQVLPDTG